VSNNFKLPVGRRFVHTKSSRCDLQMDFHRSSDFALIVTLLLMTDTTQNPFQPPAETYHLTITSELSIGWSCINHCCSPLRLCKIFPPTVYDCCTPNILSKDVNDSPHVSTVCSTLSAL
jgi:hypothetical protein